MKNSVKLLFCLIVLVSVFTITGVKAETFDGEYSTEYLLRNYNAVTLGATESINIYTYSPPGELNFRERYNYDHSIDGAVLVNGDFSGEGRFGEYSDGIKSYISGIKGGDITAPDNLVTDDDYIDFNKLYLNVLNESKQLVKKAKAHIHSANFEISSPGIYTVDNTSVYKKTDELPIFNDYGILNEGDYYYNTLLIKNYDKNALYVFNYLNEYMMEGTLPTILIMENNSPNVVNLKDYYERGDYTGNIIFNFPNAKEIVIDYISYIDRDEYYYPIYIQNFENSGFAGSIIAPNAMVKINRNYNDRDYRDDFNYFGTIIANSIRAYSNNDNIVIKKANYSIDEHLIKEKTPSFIEKAEDYDDDYYSRDYSIKDLLSNYSLVSLGKNRLTNNSKFNTLGYNPGAVKMFHITGQALINGDMYFDNENQRTAFDLESNEVTESYINGREYLLGEDISSVVIQPWDNMKNDRIQYLYQKNSIFSSDSHSDVKNFGRGNLSALVYDYINFDRLYNNIVSEQSAIDEGTKLKTGEDSTVHIKIGGNYTINDISDVKEIIFDNFEDNKDKLTIITIKNGGPINFPLISKNTDGYKGIVTNDYFGKTEATHFYEEDTFVQDTYHGNIVWNLPNATYVTLKEGAPFAGHLIAPNADVETEETHFAGCFIVNSMYGEGNTEAHFYPLTVKACDCEAYNALPTRLKEAANDYYLSKHLGGSASIVETEILGDRNQYNSDISRLDTVLTQCKIADDTSNSIVDILTNPLTVNNLILFVILGSIIGGSIVLIRKRKVKNN